MKLIRKSLLILSVGLLGAYGISRSINNDDNGARLSVLALANVEALAQDEDGPESKPGELCGGQVCHKKKKFFSKDCKDKEDSSCDPNAPSVFNQIVDPIVKIIPLLK